MSSDSYFCPRCQCEVSTGYDFEEVNICPFCAWDKKHNDFTSKKGVEKKAIIGSAALFAFLVVSIIQFSHWGEFYLSAIPLQIKTLTGLAGAEDYARIGAMCKTLKDAKCIEEMLSLQVHATPNNVEGLAQLGQVQFERKNYEGAKLTLESYVASGGKSIFSLYTYARVLGLVGQVDKAVEQYKQILSLKPDAVQVTVTQSYLDLLMKNNRNGEAVAVIKALRKKGDNTKTMMENEMRKLASVE